MWKNTLFLLELKLNYFIHFVWLVVMTRHYTRNFNTAVFFFFTKMAVPSVMVLPLLVVVFAGIYYFYNEIIHFMSKSIVRNKVVVITDAVSAMGKGNTHQ